MSCLGKSRLNEFNQNVINYLNEKSKSEQFDLKHQNFCIDWLLSEYNNQIYDLIYSNSKIGNDPNFLSKILERIVDLFENTDKKDLPFFFKSEPLRRFLSILELITDNYTYTPNQLNDLKGLKNVLNFLSFTKYQICTEPEEKISNFLNYFIEILKKKYKIELNDLFIIRHRLYGYETYLKDFIQNLSVNNNFTQSDLETLKIISSELKDINSVYLILKIIDRQSDSKLSCELVDIFWSLFDILNIDQKINLIFMIYQLNEIRIKKTSIFCLQEKNFDNEFTVCLNQISATSDQDEIVSFSNLIRNEILFQHNQILTNIQLNKFSFQLKKLFFWLNKIFFINFKNLILKKVIVSFFNEKFKIKNIKMY